jgi:hypothetical protein
VGNCCQVLEDFLCALGTGPIVPVLTSNVHISEYKASWTTDALQQLFTSLLDAESSDLPA